MKFWCLDQIFDLFCQSLFWPDEFSLKYQSLRFYIYVRIFFLHFLSLCNILYFIFAFSYFSFPFTLVNFIFSPLNSLVIFIFPALISLFSFCSFHALLPSYGFYVVNDFFLNMIVMQYMKFHSKKWVSLSGEKFFIWFLETHLALIIMFTTTLTTFHLIILPSTKCL